MQQPDFDFGDLLTRLNGNGTVVFDCVKKSLPLACVFDADRLTASDRNALLKLDSLCSRPSLQLAGRVEFVGLKGRVDVWIDDLPASPTAEALYDSFYRHLLHQDDLAWLADVGVSPMPTISLGFRCVNIVAYAVDGNGQLRVLLGKDTKNKWHFPFGGNVKRGADASLFDTAVREWEEERMGDPSLAWDNVFVSSAKQFKQNGANSFVIAFKTNKSHMPAQLFVFVPARLDKLSLQITPLQIDATLDASKNDLAAYHRGETQWIETTHVCAVLVDQRGKMQTQDLPRFKPCVESNTDQKMMTDHWTEIRNLITK